MTQPYRGHRPEDLRITTLLSNCQCHETSIHQKIDELPTIRQGFPDWMKEDL